ncbi:hypothetical protein BESB_019440 [Besnoitia besnoiti]|uniref:Proteophosphoglycan 5, related protein n=1 Tax=Besnoitia besnoiti TaxID=94643 RepID=A0A2A9M8I8_BESBE|nr:hypothetical protein BESB_019440 [Besnoitia besnoiti]PFH32003.1 hypothetical protein BESB_019440 [Besnoitia besnoiti]
MGISQRYSRVAKLRSSRLSTDITWKTTLVRSFFSDEQIDELGFPEEEIADYMIKHIVPFVKSHLAHALKIRTEDFDQFVADRLADQGVVATGQQDKIKKVMQALAAAKVQITDQTDTLEEQQNKVAELSQKLEAATRYLEEKATTLEQQVLYKEAWKHEQHLKDEAKFPKDAIDALRDLEEEVSHAAETSNDVEKASSDTAEQQQPSGSQPCTSENAAAARDDSPKSREMERVLVDGMAEIRDLLGKLLANVSSDIHSASIQHLTAADAGLCRRAFEGTLYNCKEGGSDPLCNQAEHAASASVAVNPSEQQAPSPMRSVADATTETDDSQVNLTRARFSALHRPPLGSLLRRPEPVPLGPPQSPSSFYPPSSQSFGVPRSQLTPLLASSDVCPQPHEVLTLVAASARSTPSPESRAIALPLVEQEPPQLPSLAFQAAVSLGSSEVPVPLRGHSPDEGTTGFAYAAVDSPLRAAQFSFLPPSNRSAALGRLPAVSSFSPVLQDAHEVPSPPVGGSQVQRPPSLPEHARLGDAPHFVALPAVFHRGGDSPIPGAGNPPEDARAPISSRSYSPGTPPGAVTLQQGFRGVAPLGQTLATHGMPAGAFLPPTLLGAASAQTVPASWGLSPSPCASPQLSAASSPSPLAGSPPPRLGGPPSSPAFRPPFPPAPFGPRGAFSLRPPSSPGYGREPHAGTRPEAAESETNPHASAALMDGRQLSPGGEGCPILLAGSAETAACVMEGESGGRLSAQNGGSEAVAGTAPDEDRQQQADAGPPVSHVRLEEDGGTRGDSVECAEAFGSLDASGGPAMPSGNTQRISTEPRQDDRAAQPPPEASSLDSVSAAFCQAPVEASPAAEASSVCPVASPTRETTWQGPGISAPGEAEAGCDQRKTQLQAAQAERVLPEALAVPVQNSAIASTSPGLRETAGTPAGPPSFAEANAGRPDCEGTRVPPTDENAAKSPLLPAAPRTVGEERPLQVEEAQEASSTGSLQSPGLRLPSSSPYPPPCAPLPQARSPESESCTVEQLLPQPRRVTLQNRGAPAASWGGMDSFSEGTQGGPAENRIIRMTQVPFARVGDQAMSLPPAVVLTDAGFQSQAISGASLAAFETPYPPSPSTLGFYKVKAPSLPNSADPPPEFSDSSLAPRLPEGGSAFPALVRCAPTYTGDGSLRHPALLTSQSGSDGASGSTPILAHDAYGSPAGVAEKAAARPASPEENFYWAGVTDAICHEWRTDLHVPGAGLAPPAAPTALEGRTPASSSVPASIPRESYLLQPVPESPSRLNGVVRHEPGKAFWNAQHAEGGPLFAGGPTSSPQVLSCPRPPTRIPLHYVGTLPLRRPRSQSPSDVSASRCLSVASGARCPFAAPLGAAAALLEGEGDMGLVAEPNERASAATPTANPSTPRGVCENPEKFTPCNSANGDLRDCGPDGACTTYFSSARRLRSLSTGQLSCEASRPTVHSPCRHCGCPGRASGGSCPSQIDGSCEIRSQPGTEPCGGIPPSDGHRRGVHEPFCGEGGCHAACSRRPRSSFHQAQAIPLVRCHSPEDRYRAARLGVGGYPVYPSEADVAAACQEGTADELQASLLDSSDCSDPPFHADTLPFSAGGSPSRSVTDSVLSGKDETAGPSGGSRRPSRRQALAASHGVSCRGSSRSYASKRDDDPSGRKSNPLVPCIPIRGSKIGQARNAPAERQTLSSLAARNRRLENQVLGLCCALVEAHEQLEKTKEGAKSRPTGYATRSPYWKRRGAPKRPANGKSFS